MENIILQTHGISVKYGNFLALDDVSISLKNKHIYGFIGENGAGKTTLMKVLTGLLYPTNGDFSLFGKNKPCDILKMRRHIGSTIEAPALYPEYSAYCFCPQKSYIRNSSNGCFQLCILQYS